MQKNWLQIQSFLAERLESGPGKVWLGKLVPSWEGGELVLSAQTEFAASFIRRSYAGQIAEAAVAVLGGPVPVRIVCRPGATPEAPIGDAVAEELSFPPALPEERSLLPVVVPEETCRSVAANSPAPVSLEALPSPKPLPVMQLALPVMREAKCAETVVQQRIDWRFSFDDFVVGPSNQLAYASSQAICSGPHASDILYLSSAPGLGKTHLVHAVGNKLSATCNRSRPKVEYLTAEEFAGRFYYSLKSQETDKFKARYRDLDLLLLEDVHFLQGKEKMQAELLATIKALQYRGGKVVFSSSFAPRDLKQMDEQLLSRLGAGLLSFIELPDEETRRRILRRKASLHQVLLPEDVEDVLARHIHADVRQIESCLQNLILKAQLYNSGITMQMAWEVLGNYASHTPILDLDAIVRHVCKGYGLTREQLVSQARKQEYVMARNTAFFLARKHTDLSLEAIGRQFNRRHSTVMKGITNLEREISRQSPVGLQMANTLAMIERNGNLLPGAAASK